MNSSTVPARFVLAPVHSLFPSTPVALPPTGTVRHGPLYRTPDRIQTPLFYASNHDAEDVKCKTLPKKRKGKEKKKKVVRDCLREVLPRVSKVSERCGRSRTLYVPVELKGLAAL
jgi:hypothetical protein